MDTAVDGKYEGNTTKQDQAFERLWQAHREKVWRLVARMAGRIDAADDLTQEVSIRAYRAFGSFRGDSSFSTWVYRIAVNLVMRYREGRQLTEVSFESSSLSGAREPSIDGPEASALGNALRPMVWAAINRLAPDLRTTLILQVYEGLKYREIARIMNVSLETVKYRRHQAMLRLREELNDYEM
jgi:RNA polymerase sigma-70 factor (ECF subfamily)